MKCACVAVTRHKDFLMCFMWLKFCLNNRMMTLPFSQSFGSLSNICQAVWQDLQASLFSGANHHFCFEPI